MFHIRTVFTLMVFFILGLSFNNCSSNETREAESDTTTAHAAPSKGVYDDYPQAKLLKQYLQPYPDHLTDAAPAEAKEVRAAMAAYNAGQYQAAVDTFPNFSRRPELIGYIHLYKGVSLLMNGKEHDAFMTFQLINSKQQPAFDVSEWYRAMCYLAYNNVYETRRKLESIVEKGTYGKENAAELLDILPVK